MQNDKPNRMPNVPPFVKFVCANVPMVFDDSLSYYEALCALWKYIQGMTDVINNNATLEEEYIEKFIELKTFVDEYFSNLDVQEEINNKLDQMAEDGQLADIISQYLNSTALFGYDNVASMKSATNLVNGSFARTLGYISKNDGGAGLYKIRYITNDDVVDEGSIIEITADPENRLIAELIVEDNTIDVKQFGAIGDGIADDTLAIQKALTFGIGRIVLINNGIYLISGSLSASGNEISGNAIIKASASFAGNEMLMPHNKVSIEGIKFDCNNYAICAIGDSSDCTVLELTNCEFTGAKRDVNVDEQYFAQNSCVYLCAKDVNMINCNVHNNLSHGARLKTHVANSKANIENCNFDYNGSKELDIKTVAVGLAEYNAQIGANYDKVTITNCYATGNANTGIAPHSCHNIVIDSCVCNENGEHGICLMDGKNAVISNCICRNNTLYGIRIQGDYFSTHEYHGYKNCVIEGCLLENRGIDVDEDIDTITIRNNTFISAYASTGTRNVGIRCGHSDHKLDAFVKNACIVDNYFKGFDQHYAIQGEVPLEGESFCKNYFENEVKTGYYLPPTAWMLEIPESYKKYGTTDNIITNPTSLNDWTPVAGATISGNVITRGTDDLVATKNFDISGCPRFVALMCKFSNYTEGKEVNLGIRLRNSGGTSLSGDINKNVKAYGFVGRVIDLTKVNTPVTTPENVAKISINIRTTSPSIKIDSIMCALSDELPVLPNTL